MKRCELVATFAEFYLTSKVRKKSVRTWSSALNSGERRVLEDRALEGTPIVVAAVQDAVGEVGAVEPDAVGWVREQHAT